MIYPKSIKLSEEGHKQIFTFKIYDKSDSVEEDSELLSEFSIHFIDREFHHIDYDFKQGYGSYTRKQWMCLGIIQSKLTALETAFEKGKL